MDFEYQLEFGSRNNVLAFRDARTLDAHCRMALIQRHHNYWLLNEHFLRSVSSPTKTVQMLMGIMSIVFFSEAFDLCCLLKTLRG